MATEETKKQSRKAYGKESEQKMFSFRLDSKLLTWLNSKPNKGRYLNILIERDMRNAIKGIHDYEDMTDPHCQNRNTKDL